MSLRERAPRAGRAELSWEPLAEAGKGPGAAWSGTAIDLVPGIGVVNGIIMMGIASRRRERAPTGGRLGVLVLASRSAGGGWVSRVGVVHGVIHGIHGPALIGRLDRRYRSLDASERDSVGAGGRTGEGEQLEICPDESV